MSDFSTLDVARHLVGLSRGERAWFWFCPGIEPAGAALLLQPLGQDPDRARLRAQIASLTPPGWARITAGLLSIEQDGRVALLSSEAEAVDLEELADWVADHHADHPGLTRLRGASLRVAGPDGTIAAVFDDDALWEGVPVPTLDDSARAGAVLAALAEGERAWVWMTDAGPGGKASIVAVPLDQDPDGVRFRGLVRGARQRSGDGAVVQGIARRQPDGIAVATQVAARGWDDVFAALLGQGGDAMRPLRGVRLAFLKGGAIKKTLALPPHRDLSETVDALLAGRGWFWFGTASHGGPLLIVRPDREALKAAAQAAGATDGARGRLRAREDGTFELQQRTEGPDFREDLIGWARGEARRWPALRRLRGVTLTARTS